MNGLKAHILVSYGSINNFFESSKLSVSRTNLYAILNNTEPNITLDTIKELARVLNKTEQEVIDMIDNKVEV